MKDRIWKDPAHDATYLEDNSEFSWEEMHSIARRPRRSVRPWVPGVVALLLAASLVAYLIWPKTVEIAEIAALAGSLSDETNLDGVVQYESVVSLQAPVNGTFTASAAIGATLEAGEVAFSIETGAQKALETEKKRLADLQAKADVQSTRVQSASASASTSTKKSPSTPSGLSVPVMDATDNASTQPQAVPALTDNTADASDESVIAASGESVVVASDVSDASTADDNLAQAKQRAQEDSIEYEEFNEAVEGAMWAVRTVSQIAPVTSMEPSFDVATNAAPPADQSSANAAIGSSGALSPVKDMRGETDTANDAVEASAAARSAKTTVADQSLAQSIVECQEAIELLTSHLHAAVAKCETSGVVISCLAPGSSVREGEAAMLLGQGKLVIRADVPADVRQTLEPGMPVRIRCDESTWMGTIEKVTDDGIEIAVPQGFDETEGAAVDVAVLKEQALNSVILPEEGVATDENGTYVLVNLDGILVRREVVTGMHKNGMVAIERGLTAGDRVVVAPEEYQVGAKVKSES